MNRPGGRVVVLAVLCCVFLSAFGGGVTYALYTDRADVDVAISVAEDAGTDTPGQQSGASLPPSTPDTTTPDETNATAPSDETDAATPDETNATAPNGTSGDGDTESFTVADADSVQSTPLARGPISDSP
ncbi:hypothetical protein [Haloprofundus halophilus]|uniref:hypothetical protein n=1 Tax=Haloprofundus halophilus TaxID=2283527 RepID=UPI000E43C3ED|nr:hypothetical protein [Haloprofundus halophilus]